MKEPPNDIDNEGGPGPGALGLAALAAALWIAVFLAALFRYWSAP